MSELVLLRVERPAASLRPLVKNDSKIFGIDRPSGVEMAVDFTFALLKKVNIL